MKLACIEIGSTVVIIGILAVFALMVAAFLAGGFFIGRDQFEKGKKAGKKEQRMNTLKYLARNLN